MGFPHCAFPGLWSEGATAIRVSTTLVVVSWLAAADSTEFPPGPGPGTPGAPQVRGKGIIPCTLWGFPWPALLRVGPGKNGASGSGRGFLARSLAREASPRTGPLPGMSGLGIPLLHLLAWSPAVVLCTAGFPRPTAKQFIAWCCLERREKVALQVCMHCTGGGTSDNENGWQGTAGRPSYHILGRSRTHYLPSPAPLPCFRVLQVKGLELVLAPPSLGFGVRERPRKRWDGAWSRCRPRLPVSLPHTPLPRGPGEGGREKGEERSAPWGPPRTVPW